MDEISRRELLRLASASVASLYLGGCAGRPVTGLGGVGSSPLANSQEVFQHFSPIQRNLGDVAPRAFSGDYLPELAHRMLWNKTAYVAEAHGGKWPEPRETVDVCVVGGGISGLLSAYQLRDLKPVVLERNTRFGGNSRGESWQGVDYSLATAYFTVPEKGSPIATLFEAIGIDKILRIRSVNDPVFIDGVRYDDFWSKGTVPESQAQFRKLESHLKDVLAGKNGQKYPEIPITDPTQRLRLTKLDRLTFMDYLKKLFGGPLHPHVERVVEHYFWSACATSAYEVSAAGGLNFFAADFGSMAVTPGGNGAIAEAILRKLHEQLPVGNLRPGCSVLDVKVEGKTSVIRYVDAAGGLKALRARTVVMACPKFVVAKLIDDLEPKRKAAIARLRYRSYLVANVLVNHGLKDDFYDYFFFNKEQMALKDRRQAALKQQVTDVVYGNFAKVDPKRTVLTLFRGFPYEESRYALYQEDAYAIYRKEFEAQIQSTVLPMLGLTMSSVVDVRMARWGHPLPLNAAGLIGDGTVDAIRKPFRGRVFFVEQDNWMLPAFETAFSEAAHFCPMVRRALTS